MTHLSVLPVLPLLAVLLFSIFFFGYVYGQRRNNRINNSFLMLSAVMFALALGDFLLRTTSNSISRHIFLQITTGFFFLTGLAYLQFVYALSKRDPDLLLRIFQVLGIVAAVASFINVPMHRQGLPFADGLQTPAPNMLLILLFAIYTMPQAIYIAWLTLHAYRVEKDTADKKRLLIWLWGLITAIVYITAVDFALPSMFHDAHFEPYGIFTVIISESFAWWSVLRHNFLTVNINQLEEILGKAFHKAGDAFLLLDWRDKIMYVNDVATELFGVDAESVRAFSLPSILDNYTPERSFFNTESTLRIGGRKCAVLVSKAKLNDADETVHSILTIRDITAAKRAEEARLRVQKLESLGVLAGGIAHDFNNYLCGIVSSFVLARTGRRSESELNKILLEGERTAMSARSLSNQLLTFAKGGKPAREDIDIVLSLQDACNFAARGSRAKLSFSVPKESVCVNADDGQIRQVFQNIVLNACQAMPEGGGVKVRGLVVSIEADQIPPLNAGSYFQVTVIDAGGGIPSDILPRIFDPYFSTKSQGSGLGLTIASSIVQKHDGHITVSSSAGAGTAVTVFLPLSHNPTFAAKKPSAGGNAGGRVLIMDDVREVRMTLSMLLKQLGYLVDESASGEEAMKIFNETQKNGTSYRFVIADLVVPGGMGGKELVRKLAALKPGIPVIISSGYSDEAEIARYKEFGFAACLKKPYCLSDLQMAIGTAEGQSNQLSTLQSGTMESAHPL